MNACTSRRGLLASLAAAPIVALPALPVAAAANPDADLIAAAGRLADLLTETERLERDCLAAAELIAEMTGPVPVKPREAAFFGRRADHREAMRRYRFDADRHATRVAQVETAIGFATREEACTAAFAEMDAARTQLAGMRATTLPGVAAKARAVPQMKGWDAVQRHGWDEIVASIIVDLIAMGGEA